MQRPGEAGLTERLRLWKECEYHRIDELKSTGTHTHTHTFKCSPSVSAPLKVREMVQMAFCTKSATFLKCGQMHTYGIKLAWLPPHNTSFISFIFALPSPLSVFPVRLYQTRTHTLSYMHWPSHPHRKWLIFGECVFVWERDRKRSPVLSLHFPQISISLRLLTDGSFLNTLSQSVQPHICDTFMSQS